NHRRETVRDCCGAVSTAWGLLWKQACHTHPGKRYRSVMKLFRYGEPGKERPGVFDLHGEARDASSFVRDFNEEFFENEGLKELVGALEAEATTWPTVDLQTVRLGSPVARPSKLVAVGLNYKDHAAETGSPLTLEPKIFMKATSAICGVND